MLGTTCLSCASVDHELSAFAGSVFKGGKVFEESEITDISTHNNWSRHHRVILEVQMLASADDSTRYQRAIDIASNYIASGEVGWAMDYLKMQRGFLYKLNGNQESGIIDLEELVDRHAFNDIQEIDDPILEAMKTRQKNLAIYFNDVMRQSIGHYYLDFRKEGILPEKAYQYFIGINAATLREKCLDQLRERLGGNNEAIIKGYEKNYNSAQQHETVTNPRDGLPRQEPPREWKREARKNVPTSSDIARPNNGVTGFLWLIVFLAIVVGIGAYFVLKSKQ